MSLSKIKVGFLAAALLVSHLALAQDVPTADDAAASERTAAVARNVQKYLG